MLPNETLSMTMNWRLPCGCTMTHTAMATAPLEEIDAAGRGRFGYAAVDRLEKWFALRSGRHQCALVSKDNPNGIDRAPTPIDKAITEKPHA